MAAELTRTHIIAQAQLRAIVAAAAIGVWDGLPTYDETTVDAFLVGAIPIIQGGQRQSVALTEAYLTRMLGRAPVGITAADMILRAGVPAEEVYRRPFVNVWTALGKGESWEAGVASGRARVAATAEADVALASRSAFQAVQDVDDGIYGYQRVADGAACAFCLTIDGAYVKTADASPLHNRCGCSLEPLTRPHPRAQWLPSGDHVQGDGFAIHQHGEMGAVLTDPNHDFTRESELV